MPGLLLLNDYSASDLTSGCQPKAMSMTMPKPKGSSKRCAQEEVYLKQYQTFEEASATSGQFIDDVSHSKRLHSSLGYVPPVEFETAYYQALQC